MVSTRRLAAWLSPALEVRPIGDGLAYTLRALVLDGRVIPGARVPAERELAAVLGVSRATVTEVYNRLRDEGYLSSRYGAGTVAALPAPHLSRPDEDSPPPGAVLDLTVAALPAPAELPEIAAAAAVEDLPQHLGGPGLDPSGLFELRRRIARGYTQRGLATSPEQVLVTSGALHAWDLLLQVCGARGSTVITEQPTYPAVVDAALAHRARVVPLPVDQSGWDVAPLIRPASPPALVHLTFDGQNPTGLWADPDQRREVVESFAEPTVVVIDETMLEFRHQALSVRLPRFGGSATVVHVGSMSKAFWPGLRVGWVRGPGTLIRRLAVNRGGQDLAPPVLDQLIATRLLDAAPRMLPARRAMATSRRDAVVAAIAELAPAWSLTPPAAGLAVWINLGHSSSTALARAALLGGIRVTPGPRFTVSGTHDGYLRLPLTLAPDLVPEVIGTLARLADEVPAARTRQRTGPAHAWAV